MTDFETLKSKAEIERKNGNFAEAILLYKKLWEEYRENCNEWVGWGYAYCLKQQKEYKQALAICREVYKMNPDFEMIKNVYAWCVYYTEIAIDKIKNEEQFFKAGNAIIKLSNQEDKYSPYFITVFKILDYLDKKQVYQPDLILEWTDKLNPEVLDTSTFTFNDKDGKIRELPSKKEQYFMYRTKALLEKGLYKDCIASSENALNSINEFHYDNDIWFKGRITLSYKALKQYEKSSELLKSILNFKKEWFIQYEISQVYYEMDNLEEALKYSLDSTLNYGDIDKKTNVYKLLAEILNKNNKTKEAKKHIEFIYQIKKQKELKINQELQALIKNFNIDTNKKLNLKELEEELKLMWENLKYNNQEQLTGYINRILPNKKSGFIETENKKQYYFETRNFKDKPELIKPGQKVKFFLEQGFDKKKNIKTENAVNIKPVKD